MRRRLMGVRISEETWEALKVRAEAEGRPPSDLARFLLEIALGLRESPGELKVKPVRKTKGKK